MRLLQPPLAQVWLGPRPALANIKLARLGCLSYFNKCTMCITIVITIVTIIIISVIIIIIIIIILNTSSGWSQIYGRSAHVHGHGVGMKCPKHLFTTRHIIQPGAG